MTKKVLIVRWGMLGFIAVAASLTELLCGHGHLNWGLGYWAVVVGALWGASAGFRMKRSTESKIRKMKEQNMPALRITRIRDAGSLISMAAASGVAWWGLVIRFILHGTRWQAIPFYMLGLALLFLWGPRQFQKQPADPSV